MRFRKKKRKGVPQSLEVTQQALRDIARALTERAVPNFKFDEVGPHQEEALIAAFISVCVDAMVKHNEFPNDTPSPIERYGMDGGTCGYCEQPMPVGHVFSAMGEFVVVVSKIDGCHVPPVD